LDGNSDSYKCFGLFGQNNKKKTKKVAHALCTCGGEKSPDSQFLLKTASNHFNQVLNMKQVFI
jgi:hypothetical protein